MPKSIGYILESYSRIFMVFPSHRARGDVRQVLYVTGTLIRPLRRPGSVVHCSRSPEISSGADDQYYWNAKLFGFVASFIVTATLSPSLALGGTSQDLTAQKFENSCAGCHANGGNIVKRDATLYQSDLQKYGLEDPGELYSIIYGGKGSMPGFGEECQPKGKCTFGKRLTDGEIQDLTQYVLNQAAAGWP
jgi:cytochrome c6